MSTEQFQLGTIGKEDQLKFLGCRINKITIVDIAMSPCDYSERNQTINPSKQGLKDPSSNVTDKENCH